MLTVAKQNEVVNATVTIETADHGTGRAQLIPGGYLMTAARCVDFDLDGGIALGDRCLQFIQTPAGRRFGNLIYHTPRIDVSFSF